MTKVTVNWKIPFGKYKGLTIKQVLTDTPEEFIDASIVRMAKLEFAEENGETVKFNLKFGDLDYIKWLVTIIKQGVDESVYELIKEVSKHCDTMESNGSGDMHSRSNTESHLFS
jgi:uncharacterized protein (DUF3820 family)